MSHHVLAAAALLTVAACATEDSWGTDEAGPVAEKSAPVITAIEVTSERVVGFVTVTVHWFDPEGDLGGARTALEMCRAGSCSAYVAADFAAPESAEYVVDQSDPVATVSPSGMRMRAARGRLVLRQVNTGGPASMTLTDNAGNRSDGRTVMLDR